MKQINNILQILKTAFLIFIGITAFQACEKKIDVPHGTFTATPALAISTPTVVLLREDTSKTIISFTWSAAKVEGLTGSLVYFIELDKKGAAFSSPSRIKVGGDSLARPVTVKELNKLLASLPVNTVNDMEARLVTATTDGSAMPVYSDVLTLQVTTYPPSPYSELWLIGDATPGGWGLDGLTPLKEDAVNPFLFTYSGTFTAGEFKIATAKDYNAPFFRPLINYQDLSATGVQLNAGDPDNKWKITTPGTYNITLDILSNKIIIEHVQGPQYSQLWLIGDATAGGWSLDNATPMVKDPTNPYVFIYSGAFTGGDFKIATAKDFNAPFYRPKTDHQDLSLTAVQVTAGDPDNKWQIVTAGHYKITLNTQINTITILNLDVPQYSALWLLGDATAGGWSLGSMTPMVKSSTDAFTFTYTGTLNAGEFKIATIADFNGPFYRPTVNHPLLSASGVMLSAGDPDNKWQITTAGTYTITLSIQGDYSITIQ